MSGTRQVGRALFIAGALVSVTLISPPASDSARGASADQCATGKREVLAQNAHAVISGRRLPSSYTSVRVCLTKDGQTFTLVESADLRAPFRLAGYSFAYVLSDVDETGGESSVVVTDLRRGPDAGSAVDTASCYDCRYYHDLELRPRGSVAFIGGFGRPSAPYNVVKCELEACVRTGDPATVLDASNHIRRHSLTRRKDRVYWVHSGRTRSAPLR